MPTRPARLDPARSIDAQDYQHRPRGVTAMAKEFPAGARTGAHCIRAPSSSMPSKA